MTDRTERARTAAGALASAALAGHEPDPRLADLAARYVAGEVDVADIRAAVESLYACPRPPTCTDSPGGAPLTDDLTLPDQCPYALTGVRAHQTHDGGLALDATLLHHGAPFASVSNDGRGGCDVIRPLNPGDRVRIDAYRVYASDLLGPQGVEFEPEDQLTGLLLEAWAVGQERVYGEAR